MSTPVFLLIAALAVCLAAFFVVRPLLGRGDPERARIQRRLDALDELIDELEPDDYAKRRKALRTELANAGAGPRPVSVGLIAALALAVPVATFLLYNLVGEPAGLSPDDAPVTQLRAELTQIARSLERNPDDAEQWTRLGMAYKNIQEFSSAQHALRRALYIDDTDPFVKVELAETLMFMGNRRGLPAESRQLLNQALAVDPDQQKALWLMGIGAFQEGQYRRAIAWWERLVPMLDPNSSVYNSVRGQIAQARMELGEDPGELPPPRSAPPLRPGQDSLPPGHPSTDDGRRTAGPLRPGATLPPDHPSSAGPSARPGPVDPSTPVPPGHPPMDAPAQPQAQPDRPAVAEAPEPSFGVEIGIDPELVNGLSGSETVFVVARAASGPPTPLAVRRMTVADLPTRIGLSDSDAMVEGMNLSAFPEIVITARVSMTGDVQPNPGDLQGQTPPVSILDVPNTTLTITERL